MIYYVVNEESKSFSSNVQLHKLGIGKENLAFAQISCTLIDNFPSTYSFKSNEIKNVVLDLVDNEFISISNIEIESREDFIYLHPDTFYSLYLDLFDRPNGIEFTSSHIVSMF